MFKDENGVETQFVGMFIGLTMMLLIFLVEGCIPMTPFDNRNDAVYSPHGGIHSGEMAYSPDKQFYAIYDSSLEPKFAIYNRSSDEIVTELPVIGVIKGFAWSENSELLAVMYHGSSNMGVHIMNAMTGRELLV